jgi:spermidine/putrescine transport system substrate-binding protein
VLRGGLYTAAGLGVASLLSACNSDSGTSATSGATYPLARPDDPVTLPIFDDNQPIADGLKVEDTGALKVLNYADYMAPGVKKDFGEKYGVEVQVTPYNNYDEMLNKLNAPGAAYDLVFPGPSVLSRMVYGKLLQPLNQSYLPNLKNAWPEYQDPWYDQKSNYTVPYTVYTTGIGYRADRIDNADEQGYMMIWNGDYKGKVGVLDDAGESLAMAMLAWGITGDINTDNQDYVNQARDKLIELINLVDVKIDITQYETIATGKFTVHQAWSGDLIAGQYYVGPGVSPDVLGFWQPKATPDRTVGNDNIAIPKSSPSPVLAHTFLNYILDNDVSLKNFGWNGYQPPLTKLSAKYLIDKGYVPENLLDAVVVPKDFGEAKQFYEVPVAVQNMWLTAFQEFQSGGS